VRRRRRVKKLTAMGMVLFFLLCPRVGDRARAQNYIENFENGTIDWTTGSATAKGISAPSAEPKDMAQAQARAKRTAVITAMRNLLEIIHGIRIDSHTVIKDVVLKSDVTRNQVADYLQGYHVSDITYMSEGPVEAKVTVGLRDRFANLLLPESIKPIQPIEQEGALPRSQRGVYTGLVVDARGIRAKPAMSPKIVDEGGNELYGSSYVSRDYAVAQGMVGYAKDLAAAQKNDRVAPNPLTIKGIRTAATGVSDIVISDADAAKIRREGENLSVLKRCRVMIILD
jgi:hypothetical protein